MGGFKGNNSKSSFLSITEKVQENPEKGLENLE
jgi:hypothetical protein